MITPTGHHVLVDMLDIKKESEGGILIASLDENLARRAQNYGVVLAIGPQAWQSNVDYDDEGGMHRGKQWCKVGDVVVFPQYAQAFIEDHFTGQEYGLLNDTDIKAVITDAEQQKVAKPSFKFLAKREYKEESW